MTEPTTKKIQELLEKLADYVMNEVPKKSETDKLADYVMNEVPTKKEMDGRFEQVDRSFDQADQRFDQVDQRFDQVDQRLGHVERDVQETKGDVKLILNGMDAQVKQVEILKTEQVAIKSGLSRVEKRVDVLEKKAG